MLGKLEQIIVIVNIIVNKNRLGIRQTGMETGRGHFSLRGLVFVFLIFLSIKRELGSGESKTLVEACVWSRALTRTSTRSASYQPPSIAYWTGKPSP